MLPALSLPIAGRRIRILLPASQPPGLPAFLSRQFHTAAAVSAIISRREDFVAVAAGFPPRR
jgi:hypothetical protein